MAEQYPQVGRKAALISSAQRQAGVLLPALVASLVYMLAISAFTNQLGNAEQIVTMTLLFVAPFEILLALWKAGVRPPLVFFGGILGLILSCALIVCVLCAPVLVVMAVQAIAVSIHGAVPAVPEWSVLLIFELFPLVQLVFIIVQLVRSALAPDDEA